MAQYRNVDTNTKDQAFGRRVKIVGGHVMNMTASVAWLHLYDALAADVTSGTTVPTNSFPIPTVGDTNGAGFTLPYPISYGVGLTVVASTESTGDDSNDPSGVVVNLELD